MTPHKLKVRQKGGVSSLKKDSHFDLRAVLRQKPNARATIHGNSEHSEIDGTVLFFQTDAGCIVAAEVSGLPSPNGNYENPIFGFHIHEGESCSGSESDPFADTGMHYNPNNHPHPYHAGDLPPLFGNEGYALFIFLTDRFSVSEIIGKTVVIHSSSDDFTSQPSGNAGTKIACGEIR